ncbi:MAG: two component transcriptional regulator, LuxR family [Bacteroidetes bacterium]|jgi:DNA-binding NarL/FixJ family response regulator|nr:two component transcriptional regulator, LuxR family [Bacteroidota bacterium]
MISSKILLVDDHQIVVDGLSSILRSERHVEVKSVNSATEALNLIKKNPVDLVITDIRMPGMSGIELTRKIKELYPEIRILILSVYSDIEFVKEILQAEAEGYLLKDSESRELLKATDHILANGTYYSNKIKDLIKEIKSSSSEKKNNEQLSEREIEILKLIYLEYSSVQIAEKLFISIHTVDTHRKNILRKTGTKTLISLIKYGLQHHLISLEE